MPVCRYDILDNGPTGQPVKFALIGQQVYHKWTCDTETTDIFCMVVHDCFVDDGAGNKFTLLNDQGCGLDRHLLQNLEYTTDLMAGRESHVFKYADKAALFFQCQISIAIKEPGAQCVRPQCPEPGGPGSAIGTGAGLVAPERPRGTAPPKPAGTILPGTKGPSAKPETYVPTTRQPATGSPKLRNNRRLAYRNRRSTANEIGVIDVRAQPITALDLDNDSDNLTKGKSLTSDAVNPIERILLPLKSAQDFCMSPTSLGVFIALASLSAMTIFSISIAAFCRKSSK